MPTLVVLELADSSCVEETLRAVARATGSARLEIEDAALLRWRADEPRPEIEQLTDLLPLSAPLSTGFWQLFLSAVFLLPIAIRALGDPYLEGGCSLAAVGLEDRLQRQLRASLVTGTAAIVLLTRDATADPVVRALEEIDFTLMSTRLTRRQRSALQAAFGVAEPVRTQSEGRGSAHPVPRT